MRIELRRQKHRFFSESKSFHFSAKMILYISYSQFILTENFCTDHPLIFLPALIITTKYFKKYFLRMGIGGICTFLCSPTVPLLVITISTPAVNVLWGYFFCAQCLVRKKIHNRLFIRKLSYTTIYKIFLKPFRPFPPKFELQKIY